MSISFSCPACDGDLKVKDEFAGRKIKCPHCAKAVAVLAEELDEELDDEPEEKENRPRKKKKKKRKEKNNAPLVVGIIVGVLLLGAGVVGVAAMMRKKDDTQTKAPPPVIDKKDPPKFEPKPKKGKDLISAIARRMEVSEVNRWFQQLGVAYIAESTSDINGVGPRNIEQLGPNFRSTPLKEWHDKQWILVVWNVRLPHVQQKSSTALAWETDADGQGNRIVLMCDGSVQSIDEATFAKTVKAMGK